MTRTAFRATLELSNNDPVSALTAVGAQVQIRDAGGQPANSLFQIEAPTLQNIERVDGSGTLAANGKATIRWMLIPSDQAAPVAATEFFVGGQFSYTLNGVQVRVPLEGVKITVYPDATLDLIYFHQGDVFSDDPFTPEVEPAQPYSLVLRVKNSGAGAAKSLKISSGEPQIVSNDKGLRIDFALVGVTLDGTNMGNTLALDFGRIEPGAIKTAEWRFTSSLQGLFKDFKATFEHQDTLGSIHLSTIKSVSIHEMEHIVQAGYQFEDGKPDFLVNDVPDPKNLPDTLYLSDGSTNPVQVVEQSSVPAPPSPGNLTIQLTASMPAGWAYLRVPEPSNGQLQLSRVRRSDGVDIALGTNVWITDRTFVAPGQRPVRENILHLLDYNSTGSYTLTYGSATNGVADSVAPVSLVTALPAQSLLQFPVIWSGQDNDGGRGIAFFDIFVSTNGGPFQVWLSQTTLHGAIFSGTQGATYAFYSVATDVAGNRQPTPGAANAQTTVNLVNQAPTLAAIANQTVNEGSILTLTLVASDPDLPNDTLTFSLGAGAPPGMTIDSVNGIIQWPTSEANGPGTNVVTVIVRDSGVPSLSDSKTFSVLVNEANQAPSLAAIPSQTVAARTLISVPMSASDSDLPPNVLTFSLASGAPTGASIHPVTGLFTWTPSSSQGPSTNAITVRVTDNGVPPLSATQTLRVVVTGQEDMTPPTVSCPASFVIDAGADCRASVPNVLPGVTVSDDRTPVGSITITQSPPAGASLGLGTTNITVTATDGAGNRAACTTTVTVIDSTPPRITCPPATTIAADANCQARVPNVIASITASDECTPAGSLTISQSPAAGTLVGLGITNITVTATDAAGNRATCTTTLTVVDTVPPTISCPANIAVVTSTPDERCAAVNYVAPRGSADCPQTIVCLPASGSCFPLGTSTVTCTATDAAGNTASCTFSITVTAMASMKCPKGQGYWKNNPAAWPLTSVALGSETYTQAELVTLLKSPVTGDASLILAKQLIAAKLNIANGSDATPIIGSIQHADGLFSGFRGKLPFAIKPSSSNGQLQVKDASRLGDYNDGLLTADCVP